MRFKIRNPFKRAAPESAAPPVSLQDAIRLHQTQRLDEAEAGYAQALDVDPHNADALHLLGVIAGQKGDPQRAVELMDKALATNPSNAACLHNRGLALKQLGKLEDALASFDRAVALQPNYAEAYSSRGLALHELGRKEAAVESFQESIAIDPRSAVVHYNLGRTLQSMDRVREAIECYGRAIALRGEFFDALFNRAAALRRVGQCTTALSDYDKALALRPDHADTWVNRGSLLAQLGHQAAAVEDFDRAIGLHPHHAQAHWAKGHALAALDELALAQKSLKRALEIDPTLDFAQGALIQIRLEACDWLGIEKDIEAMVRSVERGVRAATPFHLLAAIDAPDLQRKAAEIYIAARHPASNALGPIGARLDGNRIRIGYFSADFRNHSVAFLTAALFESHDRERFEIIGFSFGPGDDDDMRQRLTAAFDRFVDVRDHTDLQVAGLARELGVDIAVDLGGFTEYSRTGIFAARAAPVQLSYLGYLGTMGAPYYDYLFADEVIVPRSHCAHYAEKIAFLPTYQPNDSRREIDDRCVSRRELGLPEEGFVFCCFNNSYKISARSFACWMRILQQCDGSAFLLYVSNAAARKNLEREIVHAGISSDRVAFADVLPRPEYLARFRAADLFLDTWPYNAGTVASDALWSGLPVLTRRGDAFASRVGASVLAAVELPELVTETDAAYVDRAVALATDRAAYESVRAKLARQRLSTRLFDTMGITRSIEAAYAKMHERRLAGLPPDHLAPGDRG